MRPLASAQRTIELLRLFEGSRRPMRLAEVAVQSGLSRATAYQRLLTLQAAGFLEQQDDSTWRLTLWPLALATAALEQAGVSARVDPLLADLVRECGETASLAVLERGEPVIVARVEGDAMLRAVQKIGTSMDLAESASGRVLVAFADEATLAGLAADHPLPPIEARESVRTQGWAVSSGLSQTGVRAIAAPVRDARGLCRGAVSLVMPEQRFQIPPLIAPLLRTASALSQLYHGSGPNDQPID